MGTEPPGSIPELAAMPPPAILRVASTRVEELVDLVTEVPEDRMSEESRRFVRSFLVVTYKAITRLVK
jgi:hypothetical protein